MSSILYADEDLIYSKEDEVFQSSYKKILSDDYSFSEIDYIHVQKGSKYYSWLGHSLLRFRTKNNGMDDLTLGFVADFPKDFDFMLAAFGGENGYNPVLAIKSLKEYIKEYIVQEKRFMRFYKLKLNANQKEKVLTNLREWIKNPLLSGKYAYFKNSCTTYITKLLIQSNVTLNSHAGFPFYESPFFIIPSRLPKLFFLSGVSNYDYFELNEHMNLKEIKRILEKQ